jgi:DNA sulfur modification protein DndC
VLEKLINTDLDLKIKLTIKEIKNLYLSDNRPWVLGYSGGKDSTVILSLLVKALELIPLHQRNKKIFVISTNTLLEYPMLLNHVNKNHELLKKYSQKNKLPINFNHLQPKANSTFWVNIIGRGYPAPTRTFRWCSDRLKIKPGNEFILEQVNRFGEVILLLGLRKQESTSRAQAMNNKKIRIENSILSKHHQFSQAFVYAPIRDFSITDVWDYLLNYPNPWNYDNKKLLNLYSSKNSDEGEFISSLEQEAAGGTRFGCWSCTLIKEDKCMLTLLDKGETWLKELKKFRDDLYQTTLPENKSKYRDFIGRNGRVRFINKDKTKISRGPYLFNFRKHLLTRLLTIQKNIEEKYNMNFILIHPFELNEIRYLWMKEEGDWEDSVAKIYKSVYNKTIDFEIDDYGAFSKSDRELLAKICKEEQVPTNLVVNLIDVERQLQGMTKRASFHSDLDKVLKREWRTETEYVNSMDKNENK